MTKLEEFKYLKKLNNEFECALWEAAHFLGLGTPTAYCTIEEAASKLLDRIYELKDEIRKDKNGNNII